ncbi:MAG: hypothetical protein HC892_15310 [Saprospiraceae bacterium]|nr:hypothetical protein [Saprospiraceae bacterium]
MMKPLKLFVFCSLLLSSLACEKESAGLSYVLQYDNGNVTGPILPAGTHELAVRFTTTELTPYLGQQWKLCVFLWAIVQRNASYLFTLKILLLVRVLHFTTQI